jgi:LmbE family N-acetylglucosaminyl deacetylase
MKKAAAWGSPLRLQACRQSGKQRARCAGALELCKEGTVKLNIDSAEVFVPDGRAPGEALARTTHMAVGAHQDDLEIMAFDGILRCFQQDDKWFTGVVVTNGSGSPRDDLYKDYTDTEMRAVRRTEQVKAAVVGEYAAQVMLDYPSSAVKDGADRAPVEDLVRLLKAASPHVLYTHSLSDKHDTHVAVTLRVIEAIRSLPEAKRPQQVYGCEVWRDLDWLLGDDKVTFDVSAHQNLQAALLGVFDSQISGGKRYDLATMGRRRANATYYASHSTDIATGMIFAMDLTPLIENPDKDVGAFVLGLIDRFSRDVTDRLAKFR